MSSSPPIELFDPHFHVWDLNDKEGETSKEGENYFDWTVSTVENVYLL